jgi:hypothetical protein
MGGSGEGQEQWVDGDAFEVEEAPDDIFDQVVGAGCPCGDADGGGAGGQPVYAFDFLLEVKVVVLDDLAGDDFVRVLDEVGGQHGLAHFCEVRGVGGIVAADDDEEVERFGEEFLEGVLTVLRGAADGIEESEMLGELVGAVASGDGATDAALDLFGLAAEHGGLVGDADCLEVDIGVEAIGIGALEFLEKLLFVAAVDDVIADVIGFGEGKDDEVMALAGGGGPGGGGFGFLVPGFAVDDAGDGLVGILAHPFPDAHDVAAGGIHKAAPFLFEEPHGCDLGAEGGDNDDIVGFEVFDAGVLFLAGEELDAHGADLVIDLGVMDDFAENIDGLFGKTLRAA